MEQQILFGIDKLEGILRSVGAQKVFLVCGKSFNSSAIKTYIDGLDVSFTLFHDFSPNPTYEDAQKGLKLFCDGNYDAILAVGGGSSMDVAKYIKNNAPLHSTLPPLANANTSSQTTISQNVTANIYDSETKQYTSLPLIAIPTTAGSGSESTKFLVIYRDGEKQSISSDKLIPEYVILEPSVLKSLPLYQKKCTVLDALCQAIEAFWSVNATNESRAYSSEAIRAITQNYSAYIRQDESVYGEIMLASNKAGRAINIAQTTAAHAMSYKITSFFGLPHGHAAAICLPAVWLHLQNNVELCGDSLKAENLKKTLSNLSKLIEQSTFVKILVGLEIAPPQNVTESQIAQLAATVNVARLSNFPIPLSKENLSQLYKEILLA